MARINIMKKFINLGPLIFLYYLSISEIDSHFEIILKFYHLIYN